jgi:hypothetical protein
MNSIEKKGLFLITIILFSIVCGFIFWSLKGKTIFEGATTIGSVTPMNTSNTVSTWMPNTSTLTTAAQYSYQFAYNKERKYIFAVVTQSGIVIDCDNNIIGTSNPDTGDIINLKGNIMGYAINPNDAEGLLVMASANTILGIFTAGAIINSGATVGTLNDSGELVNSYGNVICFSVSLAGSSSKPPTDYNPAIPQTTDTLTIDKTAAPSYETVSNVQIDPNTNEYKNSDNISSFNYDSLYNTDNLTPKYSFVNSSFMYKSTLLDETDYLNKVYFENNPLEVDNMCRNLNSTTCGLTSACVYVGNNACVPGGKSGPHTTYRDVNVDYYYYKGKCYGNCPGYLDSVISTSAPKTTMSA